ncbi:ectoine/hydroxyectoine ABC transporter permease subunit EhuC [Mangrovicoccus sp. HB161399]|uniref:ectoine/hydroxyectoine ABC transporter permease subunit EhuC n=1 Tax=Mangrovicoccus sp. HB161399 TaxID=2720392 RepID=UPI0015570F34|nr:ectoine/hydroxyectoine ABC transporter permease subunit EhuC [Mangrovicoccus sp. HB161399]
MSIRALSLTLLCTVLLGGVYFARSPFAGSAAVFLDGAKTTLAIFSASAVLSTAIAFAAGLGRLSPVRPLRWLAIGYVEIFRGTSALVQLFWLFYVLPLFGPRIEPMTAGILGVSLNVGAYAAIVVEASVRAVPKSQTEASIALSLGEFTRLRRIILPQAIRIMIPPFGNLAIQLFKLTALVSFIGLSDLTYTAYQLNQTTYLTVEVFTIILFMYFAIGLSITILMKLLERRFSRGHAGATA